MNTVHQISKRAIEGAMAAALAAQMEKLLEEVEVSEDQEERWEGNRCMVSCGVR